MKISGARANKRWLVILAGLWFGLVLASPAFAGLTLNVVGVDNSASPPAETPLAASEYRWLIEEDLTFHNDPDAVVPPINTNALGLNFHRSYMPVVGRGTGAPTATLSANKYYFVSVMPTAAESYAMSGTGFKTDAAGNATATVYLNKLPLPTAQIRVFVFHDNQPINNAPDLPEEQGLAGFQIYLEEPGGRYGASGGQVSVDVYGNPLGTTYNPDGSVNTIGDGVILTNENGIAVIKNLAPAKYGTRIIPPVGEGWVQTSTIEGTKVIDAWVKANEPPFFTEFGPPGPHVAFGFVKEFNNIPAGGTATISGQVVNTHMSRPPNYTFYPGAPFPDAYVGLNDMSVGRGLGIYAAVTTGESNFSIPNVPPGNYQLVIWDKNLDVIFASAAVLVNTDGSCSTPQGTCDLGQVAVFDWFGHLQGSVFFDQNLNGYPDPEDYGLQSAVNIRWRDGTVYQASGTSPNGEYAFDEVFPWFNWMVAEVDFAAPLKATGATFVVDAGGPVGGGYNNLNPQVQPGGALFRTETGEVLTQAFQLFLGQTNVMHWGKNFYDEDAGETGGISGMVFYKTTRAEPSPEDDVAQNWEPGIPRVQVNLYRDVNNDQQIDDINGIAGIQLADVDNYPLGWSEGGAKGTEDVDYNGNGAFDQGDAVAVTWTDSWDDNQPTGCPGDSVTDPFYLDGRCYDGLRNFNQVRPGVFDGGYAFPGFNSNNPDGITSGIYIVQAVPPPNYEIVSAEDMNVVFGETYVPAKAFPFVPPCVGTPYQVPSELALFPGTLHPYWDPEHPLYKGAANPVTLNSCDFKQIFLSAGVNAAADFFMHTEIPIAAHLTGFILNDLANEFDPNNPNFGEKFALPFVPVSFRDYTGREITRVYSDQYGNYNALVPSTYTTSIPMPSGMSPNMMLACMNDPGPIPGPGGTLIQDPHFKTQYTQFCYTFQYMPGATTYLDTPVEPIAAFAGQNQFPLDCEFKDGTPVIKSVKGSGYVGPYVAAPGGSFTIQALGQTQVPNPGYVVGLTLPTITRDYGFGAGGTVTLNGTALPAGSVTWGANTISVTLPGGVRAGRYQVMVRRNDTGLSSVVGVTLTVGGPAPVQVSAPGGISRWPAQPIQQAIDAASPGDLILVGEGTYEELVVMWKPVLLQGAGAHGVTINAVKTPGEKLQAWRNKVADLFATGAVDALPGQIIVPDPNGVEPGLLGTAEGPGIMVLAKAGFPPQGFGQIGVLSNARIDGLTVSGGDIGGGIYVNGYADYLAITNNRIRNNAGINGGGITIGHPDLVAANGAPVAAGNDGIVVRYNHITQNGSREGGAGGGVSIYTGANNYQVTDCWVCGNFTKGVGGGIGHQGLSNNGLIAQNTIIYNQSFNQLPATRPAAGGIAIEGFVPVGGGLSPGAGSVFIDDNLIQGNLAGAGDGGGIGLFHVNGLDVANIGTIPSRWYRVTITNNMITNNVAGIAGGGISLKDTAYAVIVNNTIARNDSAAVAGELIDPISGESVAQAAGVAAYAHSAALALEFGPGLQQTFSKPLMANNIVWQNRSFYWTIDATGAGMLVPDAVTPYRDLEVVGVAGTLTCEGCVLTGAADPFVRSYFNNNGTLSTIPEDSTPLTAAAVDEGGNFIDLRFGPLTLWDPANGLQTFGDYHIPAGSAAQNAGVTTVQSAFNPGGGVTTIVLVDRFPTLLRDYDEQNRPIGGIDSGADER
jgi:hypothetical protein